MLRREKMEISESSALTVSYTIVFLPVMNYINIIKANLLQIGNEDCDYIVYEYSPEGK
jgi:hypothetical protein